MPPFHQAVCDVVVLQFSLEPAAPPDSAFDTFTNNATEWLKSNSLNMKAPKSFL